MIHPATTLDLVDPEVGFGVFATQRISRGTVTWAADPLDRRIPMPPPDWMSGTLLARLHHYTWLDGAGWRVLCWDHGRYVNHSCAPNCGGTDAGFEVALRDILPGEQLTNDYGTLRLLPEETFVCRCGAKGCRGVVGPDLPPDASRRLARALRRALAVASRVEQPLAPLLSAPLLQAMPRPSRRARPPGA